MTAQRTAGFLLLIKKNISQWTIQREIALTILLCSLLPLIFSNLYLFSRINSLYDKEIEQYSREVVHQAVGNIENIVEQTDIVKKQLIYWSITNGLLDGTLSDTEHFLLETKTADFFRNLRINFPFVLGLYVTSEAQIIYSDEKDLYRDDVSMELVERIFDPRYAQVVLPPQERRYLSSCNSVQVVSIYKQIRDFNLNGRYGMVQIDIDFRAIAAILNEIALGEGSRIYLYNNNPGSPHVIGPDGKADVELIRLWADDKFRTDGIVIRETVRGSGWSLMAMVPGSVLGTRFSHIRTISIFLVIFLSLLAVITGLFVANRITLPLTDVVDKIERFGRGDFSQKLPQFTNHDLRILADSFNEMTGQIDKLMKESVMKEQEKKKAELMALEAQINPHFLYNTLEVVRGISLQHGLKEVSSIAKSLACIFRYSITRDREFVTLSEELDNVSHYLNVQNYRYIDRFRFSVDIPAALKERRVLRLMLQPVVENIFKHVVELRREITSIMIRAFTAEEDVLVVEVRNSGGPVSEDSLQELRERLRCGYAPQYESASSTGIGLVNVHRRLCLVNGSDRGLEIEGDGNDTVIRLFLENKSSGRTL